MNNGTCDVDLAEAGDDAEPVQFYDEKIVRGRKDHTCSECGDPIPKGEAHRRTSYKFEGKFSVERMCAICQEVAGEFNHRVLGGLLWEALYDEWDNGAHVQACINRLSTARAKEHMRQQWVRWHDMRARQRQAYEQRRKADAAARAAGRVAEEPAR